MRIENTSEKAGAGAALTISIPLQSGQRLIAVAPYEHGVNAYETALDVVECRLSMGDDEMAAFYPLFKSNLTFAGVTSVALVWSDCKWVGDLPIDQPQVLRVKFTKPASGLYCGVRYIVANPGEVIHGGLPHQTLETHHIGKMDVIEVTSAAAAQLLDLRPTFYEIYRIINAHGYHDDTAASHILSWWFHGAVVSYERDGATNRAANAFHPLGLQENLYIDYNTYLTLKSADAIPAGKKLYIKVFVQKFGGLL